MREKGLTFININRCVDVEEAREHTIHIAIDHGMGQVEGNGSNGCCGIAANAL